MRECITWDEFFMGVAMLSSARSKDPNSQVGACIVRSDNRILSIGYNGAPNGFSDENFPWEREGDYLDTKYPFVCHAEFNAILNYYGSRNDLIGAKIYVALFPCNECAKAIIQTGISEVVYLSDKYDGTKENIASKRLFKECNVKLRQMENVNNRTISIPLNVDEKVKF